MRNAGDGIRATPLRGFDCAPNRAEEAGGGELVYQMLLLPHPQTVPNKSAFRNNTLCRFFCWLMGNRIVPNTLI
ncbi:hypothetical protein ACVMAJ_003566 [Bradyrhizobium sp. USDA 4448]